MSSLFLARASTAIRYFAILSFAAFVLAAIFLGGDALNGHAENGRYFLSWDGRLTEVSSLVFGYSRYHAIASFALLALAAISVPVSKPSPSEAKWQGRLVLTFIVCSAALSFFKYDA